MSGGMHMPSLCALVAPNTLLRCAALLRSSPARMFYEEGKVRKTVGFLKSFSRMRVLKLF